MHNLSKVTVSPDELRVRFNRGYYYERACAGEFSCCVRDEGLPSPAYQSSGARSLTIGYLDANGQRRFLVHFYLEADGTIGGSGRVDHQWLIEDGVIYRIDKTRVSPIGP